MTDAPDLEGRQMICAYFKTCKNGPHPTDPDSPFFEFEGEGSYRASVCVCGYTEKAHEKPHVKCNNYKPSGAREFDRYYCGCHGWD